MHGYVVQGYMQMVMHFHGLAPSMVTDTHPHLGYILPEVGVIRRDVQMDVMRPLAVTSHHEWHDAH